MTKYVAALAVFALGVALSGLASGTPQKDTYKLTANLKPRFEVPKPKGVPVGATGLFTGTAVELANDKARLAWRLTFSKLSGRAVGAHVHKGKAGKAGPVLVALCGPCRTGQRGRATVSHSQLRTLVNGAAYVNVHTQRNAAGEIRGQLKASGGSGSGGTDSETTTTTTTEPSPYP